MRLTGNWLLAQRLVTTVLYKLLRLVFIRVQHIYWQLNGTAAQKLREARLPHNNYERSAQVLDVVMVHTFLRYGDSLAKNCLFFLLLSHSVPSLPMFPLEFHSEVNRQETKSWGYIQ